MSMDLRRQCADGQRSLADLIHWPTLTAVGSLAGFAVAGLMALGWTLTRPASARQVVRPEAAPVVEAILAPVAQPERELPAFAKVQPDLGGEKPAPEPADETLAASKQAPSDSTPPRLDLQAVEAPPARLAVQGEEADAGGGLHGTAVRFARSLTVATRQAKEEDKLLLVMHISGHFEDPGFT